MSHQRQPDPTQPGEQAQRLSALEQQVEQQAAEIVELKRNRNTLELITEHMCDGMSVVDRNFVIRDANEAFVRNHGGERTQIIGRTCHEVTHGSTTPCAGSDHVCPVLEARRTGKLARVEHIHLAQAGGDRIVEVTAIPIFDDNNEPDLVVEVAHDLTDRRRAERESAERERIEGMLAATGAACHHLNQPLQSLVLGVEQLQRETRQLGKLEELAQALRADAERIAHITKQLQLVNRCITVPYYRNASILDLERSVSESDLSSKQ